MSRKRNKNDELLMKEALEKTLRQVFSPTAVLDPDDYAYLLAHTYFRMHGHELKGEDLYENGKKVGSVGSVKYDGTKLDIQIQIDKPLHFILIDIDLKSLGSKDDDEIDKE